MPSILFVCTGNIDELLQGLRHSLRGKNRSIRHQESQASATWLWLALRPDHTGNGTLGNDG